MSKNIYLVYRNNIHFNLLIDKKSENAEEINLDKIVKIHKNIEKNLNKTNLNLIKCENIKYIFDKTNVDYHRKECPNLYNEIYEYLSNEELPIRLISSFMLNAKNYYDKKEKGEIIDNIDNPFSKKNNNADDIHKKDQRKSFRDLIKRKYKIKDNRLHYIYTRCKNKVI